MKKTISDANIHDGHRSRMRHKLLRYGRDIFDTYELLEMLLYYSVPYRDTNPIAKRLLFAFDDLDGVMRADAERICEISGIGEKSVRLISEVNKLSDIIGAEILPDDGVLFTSYSEVGEYLTDYFRDVEKKCVIAMFFDSSMRLLKLKKLYDLDFESGAVRAKPFIDEAVRCNAAVVISAHNHPFSSCFATSADRETNFLISDALSAAGFLHAEHYVVSGEYYMGINSHKRFAQSRLSQMPEVARFTDSCLGDELVVKRLREPRELILPEESYNRQDADYFCDLLSLADSRRGRELGLSLLKRYRTIENVFTVSEDKLISDCGESITCFIRLLAHITSRRVTDRFNFGRSYTSAEIAEYLKALFLGDAVEKIYLMTFDAEDRITGCHLLAEGTVVSSEVLPRKAVERAISSDARSVSIAHNHPFGTTRSSSDDVAMTSHFENIFKSCDITLSEHFIVAGQLCAPINYHS